MTLYYIKTSKLYFITESDLLWASETDRDEWEEAQNQLKNSKLLNLTIYDVECLYPMEA